MQDWEGGRGNLRHLGSPFLPLPTAPCPSSISGASALCKGEPGSLDLRRQESHMTSTESSHEIMATLFWLKTFLVLIGVILRCWGNSSMVCQQNSDAL